MRVVTIIEGACQGHARCATLAPEIFDLDAEGYSVILQGREKIADGDEEAYELALLAVENCPEQAIRIDPD
jgi:ferredoxin